MLRLLALAALWLLPLSALAQAWPAGKPIRMVIPFPAGGATRSLLDSMTVPVLMSH